MTRGQDFVKNAKFTHEHRSAMSNLARCDLNKNCTLLKLHDMCHNPKCKCQKQINFSPNQFQLEGAGFRYNMKKIFKGSQTAWKKVLKFENSYSYYFSWCWYEDEKSGISSSN